MLVMLAVREGRGGRRQERGRKGEGSVCGSWLVSVDEEDGEGGWVGGREGGKVYNDDGG